MRITIPHRVHFGEQRALVGDDLVRPEAWDALRTQTDGPFGLPPTREALERAADERPDVAGRMAHVARWITDQGITSVASYGVGTGLPEVCLHRLAPELQLTLTDYAPATVERLKELFADATVVQHDLLADAPLDAELHLFHRVDTEFTNVQWRSILERFAAERVLVVASEIIDLRRILAELRRWPSMRHATRAGWVRTRGAFEGLWQRTHDAELLQFGDLWGWSLTPRSGRR